jgi:hypothetical protein
MNELTKLTKRLAELRKAATAGNWKNSGGNIGDMIITTEGNVVLNICDYGFEFKENPWPVGYATIKSCDMDVVLEAVNNAAAIHTAAVELEGEVERLKEELDATECSHADEEAAHAETLRMLEVAKAELASERAGAAGLREALEAMKLDHQTTIQQYEANGPQWTSRVSDAEYYDATYVLDRAAECIQAIDAALATPAGRDALAELQRLRGENGKLRDVLRRINVSVYQINEGQFQVFVSIDGQRVCEIVEKHASDKIVAWSLEKPAAALDGKAVPQ